MPLGGPREGSGHRGDEQSCVGSDMPVTRRKVMTQRGYGARSPCGSICIVQSSSGCCYCFLGVLKGRVEGSGCKMLYKADFYIDTELVLKSALKS